MDYETLTLERAEAITTLTLNRPRSLNAMTARMGVELNDAFVGTRDDAEARVLVVTGAGRAFCAGEDVKERPADSAEARQRGTPLGKLARGPLAPIDFAQTFRNMPKPTIAAVNGAAVRAGIESGTRLRHAYRIRERAIWCSVDAAWNPAGVGRRIFADTARRSRESV